MPNEVTYEAIFSRPLVVFLKTSASFVLIVDGSTLIPPEVSKCHPFFFNLIPISRVTLWFGDFSFA